MIDLNNLPESNTSEDNNTGMVVNILDLNTDDAIEPSIVPEGEYVVRFEGYRSDPKGNKLFVNKSGGTYFNVLFSIPAEPAAKLISSYYGIPDEHTEPRHANSMKWNIRLLKEVFKLNEDSDGTVNPNKNILEVDTNVIREAIALIGVSPDTGYGEQNYIKKLIPAESEPTIGFSIG